MDDLISREALKSELQKREWQFCFPLVEIDEVIDKMPAVDAEPVRHGMWINAGGMLPPGNRDEIRCSVCANFALQDRWGRVRASCFCPNCGAKMDMEREDK